MPEKLYILGQEFRIQNKSNFDAERISVVPTLLFTASGLNVDGAGFWSHFLIQRSKQNPHKYILLSIVYELRGPGLRQVASEKLFSSNS